MNEKEQTLTDLDLEDILKEFSGGEETSEETVALEESAQEVSVNEAEEPLRKHPRKNPLFPATPSVWMNYPR